LIDDEDMSVKNLIEPIVARLAAEPNCAGLYLSGSHARGTADAYSDLDLVAVVEAADHLSFAAGWRSHLEGIAPLVMFRSQTGQAGTLTNAITDGWDRVDLLIETSERFLRRPKGSVRALHDPSCWIDALQHVEPDQAAVNRRIVWLTEEFIRVLGLLHVGLGRKEHVLCMIGAGLLRDHLITLMKVEAGILDEGALHLSKSLPAADMETLRALPCPVPTRASTLDAHLALARAFLPRARVLHEREGLPWPEAFEDATRQSLILSFGDEAVIAW
jgi:predicted nucleotidyltransferase